MKTKFLRLTVPAVLLLSAFFALAIGLPPSIGQVLAPRVVSGPSIIFNPTSGSSGTLVRMDGTSFIGDTTCAIMSAPPDDIVQQPTCLVDRSGTILGLFNATGGPGPHVVYVYGNFSSSSQSSLSGHMAFAEFNIVPVSLTTVTSTITKSTTVTSTTINGTTYLTTVSNRTTYWLPATYIVTSTTVTTVVPGTSTTYTTTQITESVRVLTQYSYVTVPSTVSSPVYLTQTVPLTTGTKMSTITTSTISTLTMAVSTGSTTTTRSITEHFSETSTGFTYITVTGSATVTSTEVAPFGLDEAMSSPNTPFIIVGALVGVGAVVMVLSRLGKLRLPKIGLRGGGRPPVGPDQEAPPLDGPLTALGSVGAVSGVDNPSTIGGSTPHLPASSNSPPTVCFRCGAPITLGAITCSNCDRPLAAPATGLAQDTDLEAEGRLAEHGELVDLKEETTPN